MKDGEKTFQDMVIELFTKKNAHVINMEPGITNPGIPDINWCLEGIEGNLELKYAYSTGAAPLIRPNQVVWFRNRVKAGGYPMLAYYVKSSESEWSDEVIIFQGRYIEALALCKDIDDVYEVEYLRVMDPNEMLEAIISQIASWHDELNPQIITLN